MRERFIVRATLVVATLVACVALGGCKKGSDAEPPPSASATNAVAAPRQNPELQKLAGKWVRPDGGYVLSITNVGPDGVLAAGYFNPAPIQVSRAVAAHDGEGTKVFVELRDVNYPGCTYTLKYDPATDQLYGQYFQAAVQQTYDVTFGRITESGP